MFTGIHWKQEHVTAASERWIAGQSASIIAQELNKQYGTAFSKNAILGRLHRMGVKRDKPYEQPVSRKIRKDAGPDRRIRFKSGHLPPLPAVEVAPPAEFLGITFARLKDSHCRYPRGNPVAYCGQRKMDGSSYCAACHALCYERRRRAA